MIVLDESLGPVGVDLRDGGAELARVGRGRAAADGGVLREGLGGVSYSKARASLGCCIRHVMNSTSSTQISKG